jgi:hypothetical protein
MAALWAEVMVAKVENAQISTMLEAAGEPGDMLVMVDKDSGL